MTKDHRVKLCISNSIDSTIPKLGLTIVLALCLIAPGLSGLSYLEGYAKHEMVDPETGGNKETGHDSVNEMIEEDDVPNPGRQDLLISDCDLIGSYFMTFPKEPCLKVYTPPPQGVHLLS